MKSLSTRQTKENFEWLTSQLMDSTSTQENDNQTLRSLALSYKLQSSLDIETILKLMFIDFKIYENCQGIEYTYLEHSLHILNGRKCTHVYTYSLTLNDMSYGTLSLYKNQTWTLQEIKRIQSFLKWVLHPIKNAISYLQALTAANLDPLTKIPNRRELERDLSREINQSKRYHAPVSILSIDIDHFKTINDTYGHSAGDIVLQGLANKLRELVRECDMVYRCGGEEFLVILTKTAAKGAQQLAGRLCIEIENHLFAYKNHTIRTTISIGMASYYPKDSCKTFLERADEALYRAKHQGRNNVSW